MPLAASGFTLITESSTDSRSMWLADCASPATSSEAGLATALRDVWDGCGPKVVARTGSRGRRGVARPVDNPGRADPLTLLLLTPVLTDTTHERL